jgi:hypothetical protein
MKAFYETITSPSVIAIITCLAAAYFGYRRIMIQRFYTAAVEFRKEFEGIVTYLENREPNLSTYANWTYDFVTANIEKHNIAANRFVHYLRKTNRRKFMEKYKEYYEQVDFSAEYYPDKPPHRLSWIENYHTKDPDEENQIRITALCKIKNILSFANKY